MEKTIWKCGDCGQSSGSNHTDNCDIERCPKCRLQLFSCDCNFPNIALDGSYFIDENGKKYTRLLVIGHCDM